MLRSPAVVDLVHPSRARRGPLLRGADGRMHRRRGRELPLRAKGTPPRCVACSDNASRSLTRAREGRQTRALVVFRRARAVQWCAQKIARISKRGAPSIERRCSRYCVTALLCAALDNMVSPACKRQRGGPVCVLRVGAYDAGALERVRACARARGSPAACPPALHTRLPSSGQQGRLGAVGALSCAPSAPARH